MLRDRLRSWIGDRQQVRLVAPNRTHADRLGAMLRAWGLAPEMWRGGGAELPPYHAPPRSQAARAGSEEEVVLPGAALSLQLGGRSSLKSLVRSPEDHRLPNHGARQTKLAASLVSPIPLYLAICG